jgi:hypothetical protein
LPAHVREAKPLGKESRVRVRAIQDMCEEAGYERPSRQAIYSALRDRG